MDRAGEGVYKLVGGVCTAEPGGDEKNSAVRDRAGAGCGDRIGLDETWGRGEKGDAKNASVLLEFEITAVDLGFTSSEEVDFGKERSENVLERDEHWLIDPLPKREDVLEEEEDSG